MKLRWILHLDLDAFFASVEELLNPALRGAPIIVGGRPEARGVVSSASYAARRFGVRSAMPTAQALQLCPQAILLPGQYTAYRQYSHRVMSILSEYTPFLEQISIDEAFLDIAGCETGWGPPAHMAAGIQARIQDEVGLSASIGVASNKLLAKIASDHKKPHGLVIVPHGEEAAFLAPLAIERLHGVGRVTAGRLRAAGVQTIGQLAAQPLERLQALLGNLGLELWQRAHGLDDRPVVPYEEIKSVSHEETYARDSADALQIQHTLLALSERVGGRLRRLGLKARTIALKLRYSDFSTVTRQETLSEPTDLDDEIHATAIALWRKVWQRGRPVRLLGVGAHNLIHAGQQFALFDDSPEDARREKRRRLSTTIDRLRERYGPSCLKRASLMGKTPSRESEG